MFSTKNLFLSLSAFLGMAGYAFAHIGISGDRTMGTLLPGSPPVVVSTRFASGNFGWADGTDSNWGDSHRLVAFQFVLTSPVETLRISVSRRDVATQTGAFNTYLPGFSLFNNNEGFVSSTHDGSVHTVSHLVSQFGNTSLPETFTDLGSPGNGTWDPGEPFTDSNNNGVADTVSLGNSGKEGAFNALGDWSIFNDSGSSMFFDYFGHASDEAETGSVTWETENLAAGTYYIFVGGSHYDAQLTEDNIFGPIAGTSGTSYPNYGFTLSVQAIPEPATSGLIITALAFAMACRRRRA